MFHNVTVQGLYHDMSRTSILKHVKDHMLYIESTILRPVKDVTEHYISRIISRHVTDLRPDTCPGLLYAHHKDNL